jgi:glycosyltransferase involved in cell wall biosynthesis
VDTDVFHPVPTRGVAAVTEPPTLVYAGTMSELQGAGVFVEAFAAVAAEFPEARLVMYGQGAQQASLHERARALAPGRVEFRGIAPGDEVAAALSRAWVGLASLHPGMGYDYAFPTKMFASTACGTPVLYAGPGPGRAMTTEYRLGWACDWDVDQTAALMREALAHPPTAQDRTRLRDWTLAHASQSSVGAAAASEVMRVSGGAGATGEGGPRRRRARR